MTTDRIRSGFQTTACWMPLGGRSNRRDWPLLDWVVSPLQVWVWSAIIRLQPHGEGVKMMNKHVGWISGWGSSKKSGLGRWSMDSDRFWCGWLGAGALVEIRLWWGVDDGGRRTVMAVLDQCRVWSAGGCDLFVWIGPWAWAIPLCHL